MTAVAAARPSGAFSKFGVFALVAGGFALFLALLYLLGAGEEIDGNSGGGGQAHAVSKGLNGYAGLVRLVEAQGHDVERSRRRGGLETTGLLILTPPPTAKPEEITKLLKQRAFTGPTLVILSKWWALEPPQQLPEKVRAKFKPGWVMLGPPQPSRWTQELGRPFAFEHKFKGESTRWSGMKRSGKLPTGTTLHAVPAHEFAPLISDEAGDLLAFMTKGARDFPSNPAYPVAFLVEPDMANNYGLADADRAAATVALVEQLSDEASTGDVVFDLTLNGFGGQENLLTLAFRPPFLAATLSLIVALLIVGWRAFMRFGPAASSAGPDIAFGKRQLITNGAGLILRARRFALLGAPYAALSARRIAERLGLTRADPAAIDAALARRLPDAEPFTQRAARLEAASKPAEILAAAQSLDDLATTLQQGQSTR
ncbi:DUF4350 domain-containing protein [Erythrobacter sp. BLCC-B19]|uniref:DUF4350 domain-containing protein n=1 Tax=Erythrobacter sp. BLCC-B19 TaxID=3025315 RepID=UPI00236005E0|nr:DUF4350 domain-containing protein [Erythrobacter sp. BLCC-B19]WDA42747.1 DUF4350 domain-containing protein [Erythrobacter sp. BLCC-B19]